MANRYTQQFMLTQEKRATKIFANVSFGASGAPTLSAINSKGVLSVTRNAQGRFTFAFGTNVNGSVSRDVYVKLMNVSAVFNAGTSAPTAPIVSVRANNVSTAGTASITLSLLDYAGAETDPASGEIGYFEFTFGDSTAP